MIYDMLNPAVATLGENRPSVTRLSDGSMQLTYAKNGWQAIYFYVKKPVPIGAIVQFIGLMDSPAGTQLVATQYRDAGATVAAQSWPPSGAGKPFEVFATAASPLSNIAFRLEANTVIGAQITIREFYLSIGERVTLEQARIYLHTQIEIAQGLATVNASLSAAVATLRTEQQGAAVALENDIVAVANDVKTLFELVAKQQLTMNNLALGLTTVKNEVTALRENTAGQFGVVGERLAATDTYLSKLEQTTIPKLQQGQVTPRKIAIAGGLGAIAGIVAEKSNKGAGVLVGGAVGLGALMWQQRGN